MDSSYQYALSEVFESLTDPAAVVVLVGENQLIPVRAQAISRLSEIWGTNLATAVSGDLQADSLFAQQIPRAFASVPEETHRVRIIEALLPSFDFLCQPDVRQLVGDIVSLEVEWEYKSRIYEMFPGVSKGFEVGGETLTCTIELANMGESLTRTWKTHFPWTTSVEVTLGFDPHKFIEAVKPSTAANDLLGPVLDQLPEALLARTALENTDQGVRRAVVARMEDQEQLAEIAAQDKDSEVRKAAVERLNDPGLVKGGL